MRKPQEGDKRDKETAIGIKRMRRGIKMSQEGEKVDQEAARRREER